MNEPLDFSDYGRRAGRLMNVRRTALEITRDVLLVLVLSGVILSFVGQFLLGFAQGISQSSQRQRSIEPGIDRLDGPDPPPPETPSLRPKR